MDVEQAREDAKWARGEGRQCAHLAAQCGTLDDEGNRDYTAASMRFDRLAIYAKECARLVEGIKSALSAMRRDKLTTEEAARVSVDQRKQRLLGRLDQIKETTAELTALLGEGEIECPGPVCRAKREGGTQ